MIPEELARRLRDCIVRVGPSRFGIPGSVDHLSLADLVDAMAGFQGVAGRGYDTFARGRIEAMLAAARPVIKRRVGLHRVEFELADASELDDYQIGYAVSAEGESLVGDEEGDWRASWFVIGADADLGDPVFVDRDQPHLPVFMAAHGMGEWEPKRIARSLEAFLR